MALDSNVTCSRQHANALHFAISESCDTEEAWTYEYDDDRPSPSTDCSVEGNQLSQSSDVYIRTRPCFEYILARTKVAGKLDNDGGLTWDIPLN